MTNKTFMQGNSEFSSEKIIAIFMNLINEMKIELEPHQTQNTSIPAAPNTAKFMASVSGKVSLEKNVIIHGAYNSSVMYDSFLKIGSGIKLDITIPIKRKFINSFKENLDIELASENSHIKCSDGKTVSIAFTYGTNWGGVGLRVS